MTPPPSPDRRRNLLLVLDFDGLRRRISSPIGTSRGGYHVLSRSVPNAPWPRSGRRAQDVVHPRRTSSLLILTRPANGPRVTATTKSDESFDFRWPIIAVHPSIHAINFSEACRHGSEVRRLDVEHDQLVGLEGLHAASALRDQSVSSPPVAPTTSIGSIPTVRNMPRINATPAMPAA